VSLQNKTLEDGDVLGSFQPRSATCASKTVGIIIIGRKTILPKHRARPATAASKHLAASLPRLIFVHSSIRYRHHHRTRHRGHRNKTSPTARPRSLKVLLLYFASGTARSTFSTSTCTSSIAQFQISIIIVSSRAVQSSPVAAIITTASYTASIQAVQRSQHSQHTSAQHSRILLCLELASPRANNVSLPPSKLLCRLPTHITSFPESTPTPKPYLSSFSA
jgi:hypothetical protein